ncbi:zf-HC2 domain-containing protein [Streptomyces sp. TRM 70361]|uniref:anti-sigma factor family protein n=1 Tax=Streptomyces sp. TRM 70361 TaxID=3116553 RepID=UPI002E7C0372|nr:zf-HC2 domain-containing protein [Streptomyces sp. TRM 70361]MEE1939203.1 zf-HC2 domain-containing protein [Streptomyces sp. TRM 70361]
MSGTFDDLHDPEPTAAEQHLGDRLAALVDGELGHETRERVLAHLATCHACKTEADAQRRLKSVFAETAPPPPSEGLLARLQGLPGGLGGDLGGPGDLREPPLGSRGPDGTADPAGSAWEFEYLPPGSVLTPDRGFRIHETDRPASRGRRFAFAAAGAVSLAAFALGGALTSTAGGPTVAAGGEGGTAASPPRTAAAGTERGREREQKIPGTPVGPAAAPTPTPTYGPTRLGSRVEAEFAARQYELMTVPVLDVPAGLRPPLIHPAYPARQLRTAPPPGSRAPGGQPLMGTSSAPAPGEVPTASPVASPTAVQAAPHGR